MVLRNANPFSSSKTEVPSTQRLPGVPKMTKVYISRKTGKVAAIVGKMPMTHHIQCPDCKAQIPVHFKCCPMCDVIKMLQSSSVSFSGSSSSSSSSSL